MKFPFSELELYIFDLDGTLVDSSVDIANSVNYALAEIGLPPWPLDKIKTFVGKGTKVLMKNALGGHRERSKEGFEVFSKHYAEHLLDKTDLYPGVRQLLSHLKNKKLAVLSNKRQAFCDPIIDGLGLRPYFSIVVGGDTLPKKKPDPDPILHICDQLKIRPKNSVMIGDSSVDVASGKAAGTWTVGILEGFGEKTEIEAASPDFFLSNLSDLKNMVGN